MKRASSGVALRSILSTSIILVDINRHYSLLGQVCIKFKDHISYQALVHAECIVSWRDEKHMNPIKQMLVNQLRVVIIIYMVRNSLPPSLLIVYHDQGTAIFNTVDKLHDLSCGM